ncbi:MAG: ParB N-terminal domain-containing protein [Thermoplasmata archaeon]|nr:ParB N-terminal domain-containing protein [Thermoplasmata archaeon]
MTRPPEFRLVPVTSLLPHEQVDEADVGRLAREIRTRGLVREPIWVTRAEGVILNGHHRYAALRTLGVRRVPAWVVDYSNPAMALGRWGKGPPLEKDDVIRRARAGALFPPKTSRHVWRGPVPEPHPTTLAELQADGPEGDSGPDRREGVRPDGSR